MLVLFRSLYHFFFFSSRRRHTRWPRDWSSDVCSSDLRLHQPGGTLSGGEQQQLVIARALMAHPRLLILDEPSLGLAPALVEEIFRLIRELHEAGTTILLVEQNVRKTLQIADRAYLLNLGRLVASGTPSELQRSVDLESIYLGGGSRTAGGEAL